MKGKSTSFYHCKNDRYDTTFNPIHVYLQQLYITYVFGTFRIVRCLIKTIINVPFPSTPTIKIIENRIGTRYVSGRYLYGTKSSFDAFDAAALKPGNAVEQFVNTDESVLLKLDNV